MKFKILSYLAAIAAICFCSGNLTAAERIVALIALTGGMGINPSYMLSACAELTAFRTAVESLDQRVLRSPRLGRANFWRNMIPRGTFVKNEGVTRSKFTVKATEPADNQSLWQTIALSSGQPSPSCDTNYEEIGVNFLERTYSPKQRRFMGPIVCKADLTFQHNPEQFLNAYVDELGRVMARIWEFSLRADLMAFVPWFVDGNRTSGPNAMATAARAFEGASQDRLNDIAVQLINVGAGSEPDGGYTTLGPAGPQFPIEIGLKASGDLVKANSTLRQDAQYASMGMDGGGDLSLFKAIGADRIIGNFRHVPTSIAPRFNYTGGTYVQVSPFKDITAVGSDGVILTDQYNNAAFEGIVGLSPRIFTAEVVLPSDWKFPNAQNYNGDWEFKVGGNLVCNPATFDPQQEKGRHFAKLEYAAAPDYPYLSFVYIFKRCATTTNSIFCS